MEEAPVTDQANALVSQMREMARHMAWADATVWGAVLAVPQAAGDEKISDTLHHMHLVQHIFLQAWTGAQFAVRERKDFASIADINAWGMEARRGVLSFVEQVSAGDLAREMRMPWAAFFEQQAKQTAGVHTLGESVLQVFLHTQHHRGQVCMRMREVGVAPPTIDFILWLWASRPSEALSV
jgi:uncharacterized damage-inducible protein DinB